VLAIDTNVIVRLLVRHDDEQLRRAKTLVASSEVFVANTVMLECEWVLRSAYGFDPASFAKGFRGFAGLPNVKLEDPQLAVAALEWHEQGMDFADAMHLGRAEGCEAFVSFDKGLAKAAVKLGAMEVRAP
jgi:predicted nucleic-acid-binding protein